MSDELNELRNTLKTAEARINVLENELAKKSEVLETTEKLLESSQQQYKEMLNRISEMSMQQKQGGNEQEIDELHKQIEISNAQLENQTNLISQQRGEIESLQLENEKLKKSIQFHSSRSTSCSSCGKDENRIQKSVYQLRQAQEDILDLKAENENLKSQISRCKREEKEWNNFSKTIFDELSTLLPTSRLFPRDDSVMQRSCLSEIVHDIVTKVTIPEKRSLKQRRTRSCCCDDEYDDTYEGYKHRYYRARESLGKVTERCDNMLDMMNEPGYNRYAYSEPYERRYEPRRNYGDRYRSEERMYEQRRNYDDQYNEESERRYESERMKERNVKIAKERKCSDSVLKEHRKELGKCVRELHGITKQIKGDYKELFD